MLALIGFTRFPIFYSSDGRRILGSRCGDESFNGYVLKIRDKRVIAVKGFANIQMRRRFVIKGKAINPSLKTSEDVVRRIYVYPSLEGEEALNNVYAMGIDLRGARNPVFVPLLSLGYITEDEAQALLSIPKERDIGLKDMIDLLRSMNLDVQTRALVEGIVVEICDPNIGKSYQVLVDERGRVLNTNVCIESEVQLYLPEMVLLIRRRGNVFVYSRMW